MPAIGHFGIGLAAKRIAPEAPLALLLVASDATDLLWGGLALAGIESVNNSTWSHSLFTSVCLSLAAGLGAGLAYRNKRVAATVGLVVLSHWLLDCVVWKDTLPLLFGGSPQVGLGLYGPAGLEGIKMSPAVLAIELGLPILGALIYLRSRPAPRLKLPWRRGVTA